MYKRRARVLFLESGNGTRARWAQALAARAASPWLLPMAAACGPGRPDTRLGWVASERGVRVNLSPCAGEPRELARQCDLVIALTVAPERFAPRLAGCPLKAWSPVPRSATLEDLRALGDQLEARLRGLAGGFRLMQGSGSGNGNRS
jgi:hypothetical protein